MKIYLSHSHSGVPTDADHHLAILAANIENLDARVIKPEFSVEAVSAAHNPYECRMAHVHDADLMVVVMDHIAPENFFEIHLRCMLGKPLLCFFRRGTNVHPIVRDCIRSFRKAQEDIATIRKTQVIHSLADPIEYQFEENGNYYDEIESIIMSWMINFPDYFHRNFIGKQPVAQAVAA